MVLMVLHGLIWLYAAWITLGGGDSVTALSAAGMLAMGVWNVSVPFGLTPGRSTLRVAALAVTCLAIAVELLVLALVLHSSLDTSGCPPEGCEPIGELIAIIAALAFTPPLLLGAITAMLLSSRSAKTYLARPDNPGATRPAGP